jgi:hypothetical protein
LLNDIFIAECFALSGCFATSQLSLLRCLAAYFSASQFSFVFELLLFEVLIIRKILVTLSLLQLAQCERSSFAEFLPLALQHNLVTGKGRFRCLLLCAADETQLIAAAEVPTTAKVASCCVCIACS